MLSPSMLRDETLRPHAKLLLAPGTHIGTLLSSTLESSEISTTSGPKVWSQERPPNNLGERCQAIPNEGPSELCDMFRFVIMQMLCLTMISVSQSQDFRNSLLSVCRLDSTSSTVPWRVPPGALLAKSAKFKGLRFTFYRHLAI